MKLKRIMACIAACSLLLTSVYATDMVLDSNAASETEITESSEATSETVAYVEVVDDVEGGSEEESAEAVVSSELGELTEETETVDAVEPGETEDVIETTVPEETGFTDASEFTVPAVRSLAKVDISWDMVDYKETDKNAALVSAGRTLQLIDVHAAIALRTSGTVSGAGSYAFRAQVTSDLSSEPTSQAFSLEAKAGDTIDLYVNATSGSYVTVWDGKGSYKSTSMTSSSQMVTYTVINSGTQYMSVYRAPTGSGYVFKVVLHTTESTGPKLDTPQSLTWDGLTAKWSDVSSAEGYEIVLLKGGNQEVKTETTASGVCEFDFTDDIIAEGEGSYTFDVIAVAGSENSNSEAGKSSPLLITKLEQPIGLNWDSDEAKWEAAADADSYEVTLIKRAVSGDIILATKQASSSLSCDFSSELSGHATGVFYFTVTAKSSDVTKLESDPAEVAAPKEKGAHLAVPTGLAWDDSDFKATWASVDNATGYIVSLYKGTELVGDPIATVDTSHDFTNDIRRTGSYTFKVIATADGYLESPVATSGAKDFAVLLLEEIDEDFEGYDVDYSFPTAADGSDFYSPNSNNDTLKSTVKSVSQNKQVLLEDSAPSSPAPNSSTLVVGFVPKTTGKWTIEADFTPTSTNNGWTMMQIAGTKASDGLEGEVLAARTATSNESSAGSSGSYVTRIDGSVVASTGKVGHAANTKANIKFNIDLDNKAVEMFVNDTSSGIKSFNSTNINKLTFTTPASATVDAYVDNIKVVSGSFDDLALPVVPTPGPSVPIVIEPPTFPYLDEVMLKNKTWNISEGSFAPEDGALSATKDVDELTVGAKVNFRAIATPVNINGIDYSRRITMYKNASLVGTENFLSFDVAGSTNITVIGSTGSTTDSANRTLSVCTYENGKYVVKGTMAVTQAVGIFGYQYSGPATKLYIFPTTNQLDIYELKIESYEYIAKIDLTGAEAGDGLMFVSPDIEERTESGKYYTQKIGEDFIVDFEVQRNPGINALTLMIDYDPEIIRPVEGANVDDTASFFSNSLINQQIDLIPDEENLEYKNANGIRSAKYLGRIKLSAYNRDKDEILQMKEYTKDGVMFRIKFKAVSKGISPITVSTVGTVAGSVSGTLSASHGTLSRELETIDDENNYISAEGDNEYTDPNDPDVANVSKAGDSKIVIREDAKPFRAVAKLRNKDTGEIIYIGLEKEAAK